MFRAIFLTAALATIATPSFANKFNGWVYYTGNVLHQHCQSEPTFCFSYVAGVVDSINGYAAAGIVNKNFCFTPAVTPIEAAARVQEYLANNPQDRGYEASYVVIQALEENFPC